MKKPLIVYVSGAPGSGKTTLARILAEQLYVPNISSDLIHGGVALTNPNHERKGTLQNIFVPTMVNMVQMGISFVVDQVLQRGLSEEDIVNKLRPHAEIINIHTICINPIERYVARVKDSTLPSVVHRREHLLGLEKLHKNNLAKTSPPLELNVPLLVVNTDDGYDPSLDKILEFIKDQYN